MNNMMSIRCSVCGSKVSRGQSCTCSKFVYKPGDQILFGEVPHHQALSHTEQVVDKVFMGQDVDRTCIETLEVVGYTTHIFARRVIKRIASAPGTLAKLVQAYRT